MAEEQKKKPPKITIMTAATPTVMRIVPELAAEIGLNESIVLLQISYWIGVSDNLRDGSWWTFQSVSKMRKDAFPFWSRDTINRAINNLEKKGFLRTTSDYNTRKGDKTRWFSLVADALEKLTSITIKPSANADIKPVRKSDEGMLDGVLSLSENRTTPSENRTTLPETSTEIKEKEQQQETDSTQDSATDDQKAVVVKSYENNIAMITAQVADKIKAAIEDHPLAWITDAIEIAAENNKRSWAYVDAILKRCESEGKPPRVKASESSQVAPPEIFVAPEVDQDQRAKTAAKFKELRETG